MKLSHLNGLRAFEATLRNGTFTAAADELGVTVAAIGQQIRGLEDYLGIKLFDRLPSGAVPTAEAAAVAARLTTGFTQIEDVFTELGAGRERHRLSITLSQFMLDDFLAQRMPDFHRRNPSIDVSYHTGEEYVDLFKNTVDMAIRFSPEPGPEYAFEHFYKSCFMPLCTPAFAEAHALTPETMDLTGVPLFQFHDVTSDPNWVGWPELLKRHGMTRNDPGPVQQIAGYRTVLSGGGLVLCGLTESFSDLKDGRLVAPLGPRFVTQMSFNYRLIWPAGRSPTLPMRRFRDWVLLERDRFIAEASDLLGIRLDQDLADTR